MQLIFKTTVSILAGMLTTLMTERFIKFLVVKGLEVLVKKTESDADDKILAEAKKAWQVE